MFKKLQASKITKNLKKWFWPLQSNLTMKPNIFILTRFIPFTNKMKTIFLWTTLFPSVSSKAKETVADLINVFLMAQSRPLFCLFSLFSHYNFNNTN